MVPARAQFSQCAGEILALKYPEVFALLVFSEPVFSCWCPTEPKDEKFLCFNVTVHPKKRGIILSE